MRKEKEVGNLKDDIRQTDKEMKSIIDSDPAIKKNYDLLTSIIGVGIVVAVTAIVLTENFTTITNPRKYASYIAIAPFRDKCPWSDEGVEAGLPAG